MLLQQLYDDSYKSVVALQEFNSCDNHESLGNARRCYFNQEMSMNYEIEAQVLSVQMFSIGFASAMKPWQVSINVHPVINLLSLSEVLTVNSS
jgi:hypothetical protein